MNENGNKHLLITGSSGFIGRALCEALVTENFTLRVLQRPSLRPRSSPANESIESVSGDLLDAQSLQNACRNIDVVVHLAGIAHVSPFQEDEAEQIIVEGTRDLLTAAIANKVRRFIYVSSSLAQAVDEIRSDITPYGWYKREAEKLLLKAHVSGDIEVVIVRSVNVYGPGMKGNIATMISLIKRNRLPPLPTLITRLSLVSVSDVVQALRLAIESPQAAGMTYTVTDGQEYRICDIERSIYTALGKRFPQWRTPRVVLFAAAGMAGVMARITGKGGAIGLRTYRNITIDNVFDNEAICQELGFTPGTTFYQELPRIIAKMQV